MDDADIWRTAKLTIDQHGDGAAAHATDRADKLLSRGDQDSAEVWWRILQAIRFLQDGKRPPMTEQ